MLLILPHIQAGVEGIPVVHTAGIALLCGSPVSWLGCVRNVLMSILPSIPVNCLGAISSCTVKRLRPRCLCPRQGGACSPGRCGASVLSSVEQLLLYPIWHPFISNARFPRQPLSVDTVALPGSVCFSQCCFALLSMSMFFFPIWSTLLILFCRPDGLTHGGISIEYGFA